MKFENIKSLVTNKQGNLITGTVPVTVNGKEVEGRLIIKLENDDFSTLEDIVGDAPEEEIEGILKKLANGSLSCIVITVEVHVAVIEGVDRLGCCVVSNRYDIIDTINEYGMIGEAIANCQKNCEDFLAKFA